MTYFTDMNTEGFSETDLQNLNAAHDRMIAEGYDAKDAGDRLNNAWDADMTADELFAAATAPATA